MTSRRRRDRKERVTLHDVAVKAGVSPITVSRALREPDKVSEELRQNILRIVTEMGYVPDFAARALASRSSDVIGVVLPTLNFVYVPMMHGIEDRVSEAGLRIQYAHSRSDPAKELDQIRLFLTQNPAGMIVAGAGADCSVYNLLAHASCPVIELADKDERTADMAIGIDHFEAGRTAARHMMDQGYRRVALLGGRSTTRNQRRRDGFETTLRQARLFDPERMLIADEATSVALGCRLLQQLLETCPDADGVFCQNDDLALGVVFECRRRGIRVPEDFGICGFNDLDFAALSEPSITSIDLPRYRIGYQAADLLLAAIEGHRKPKGFVDVGYTLMPRETTRRVAAVTK